MNIPEWIWDYIPHWITLTVIAVTVTAFAIGKIASSQEGLSKLWSRITGWLDAQDGEEAARRKSDVDYQIADLWRQVKFLEEQLAELRLRDEMYWAWILTDQEWHRQYEFAAAENGWTTIPHKSFMEFRDEWVSNRVTRRIRKAKTSEGDLPF